MAPCMSHTPNCCGEARFFVSSVYPEQQLHAAHTLPTTSSAVVVVCGAIAEPLERALASGATLLRPVEADRSAKFRDPFGHVWILYQTGLQT